MSQPEKAKICPRCRHQHISLMYNSPVAHAWTILQCDKCLYMWRTSEPPRNSEAEYYPEQFRMSDQQTTHVENIPAIPPLTRVNK